MTLYFFPRSKEFWLYHCFILLLLTLVQSLIILIWREEKLFNALAWAMWLPLFTMATLSFRFDYKIKNWREFGTSKIITTSVIYSLGAGFLLSTIMLSTTLPFFWNEIISSEAFINNKTSPLTMIIDMVIGNGLQSQLFICAWIFIYTSITTKERAKETELFNLRLQNSLKEEKLANLTNQLNPHFLFNALNNIRFTIHENPKKADDMLIALSEILRYSLESSRHEKVYLSEELEIIHRYISIVKIQMENRLDFRLDMPRGIEAYLIPPMALQILVENAIKHGIDNLRRGGSVYLEGCEDSRCLRFTVSNSIPNATIESTKNTGIGLKNIEQRLSLLYDQQANITFSHDNIRFSVTITIPKELTA